jgi:putative FmdB family regulatory protein
MGMPLYEYECRACGQHFEYLTREGQSPACPGCQGGDLQKLLSVFAVSANGRSDPAPFPSSSAVRAARAETRAAPDRVR